MESSNYNLLGIDYSKMKGVQLKWNLKGLLSQTNYFRHLFVLNSYNHDLNCEFVEEYIKRCKVGDFFASVYSADPMGAKKVKWREKTLLKEIPTEKLVPKAIVKDSLSKLLEMAGEKSHRYSEPVIINILLDTQKEAIFAEKIAKGLRQKGVIDFVVTAFSPVEKNYISIFSTLSRIELNENNVEKVLDFYKNYLNKIALKKVELVIESQNATLVSQESSEWITVSFDRICRKYYGPSSNYQNDNILFVTSDKATEIDASFGFYLEYTFLNGKKFRTEKNLRLTIDNNNNNLRTIANRSNAMDFEIEDSFWVDKNPYQTEAFIWYSSNKEKDSMDV